MSSCADSTCDGTTKLGAYPLVNIHNSTNYIARGTVSYMSAFCSNDDYVVTPNTTWTASSRGVCLVTGINANVQTPNGTFVASPYDSSGTSYSTYAIISTGPGPNDFAVTRVVSAAHEDVPRTDGHVEPLTKQK
jgi:hypothetical protein